MQVTVEEINSLTKKLKIVLPKQRVGNKLEKEYKKLANDASIKGFRKGKVPRKVLEKNYGPKVEYEVAEQLIQETYFDALEESKIDAVVHPEIKTRNFEEDGTFSYEAEVDVKPEFELGEYKGLEIEQPKLTVTEAEIDREIEIKRKDLAPLRTVDDRGAQKGDIAVIDFHGYKEDGEPLKQVIGENYSVDVGEGRNGKEFEDAIVGLKKGEEASKEIDFPTGFPNPVLAGLKVKFEIKVKDIKERVLPDLDDEFAKDVDEKITTLEELRNNIREIKLQQREEAQKGDFSDKLMMQLLEKHNFEVPGRLITYEVNHLVDEMSENLKRQGLTLESAGMNREKLVVQYREAAEKRVRGDFILKKIAEVEDVKIQEEDIQKGFQRIANQYQMPLDEVKKYFQNRDDLLPFVNELLSEKILVFLRDQAKVKIVAKKETAAEEKVSGEKK
jgi:trigger factor